MTENERILIRAIRESANPGKAIDVAVDILSRCVTGENMESIAASYGLTRTSNSCFERA